IDWIPKKPLTAHASREKRRGAPAPRATVVPRRSGADTHTIAATSAGSAHAASDHFQPPSQRSSGTAAPAASTEPSTSAIENAPVRSPESAWKRVRMKTGSSACASAIATPIASPATNSEPVLPSARRPVPAAVSSAQATSACSIGTRAATRGATGAKAPMNRTGSVVSIPAAAPDSPRSARMSATSGGRPASTERGLSASRTTAVTTAAPARSPRLNPRATVVCQALGGGGASPGGVGAALGGEKQHAGGAPDRNRIAQRCACRVGDEPSQPGQRGGAGRADGESGAGEPPYRGARPR